MPLQQSDYDQARRYLQQALNLLERDVPRQSILIRRSITEAMQRLPNAALLTPDEKHALLKALVPGLRAIAEKVSVPDAKMEIRKACAVLFDRTH